MANDRRFLFRGRLDEAVGQVFNIGPTPTQLTAAGLAADTPVRVQVLAGANVRRADESDWADATASNGRPLVLSMAHSYVLLTQPGVFRLHPTDLTALPEAARVWLEDATYLGQDRIIYTSDLHGAYGDATAPEPLAPNPACGEGMLIGIEQAGGETWPYTMPPIADGADYVVVSMSNVGEQEPTEVYYGFKPVADAETDTLPLSRCDEMVLCPEEYEALAFYGTDPTQRLAVKMFRLA